MQVQPVYLYWFHTPDDKPVAFLFSFSPFKPPLPCGFQYGSVIQFETIEPVWKIWNFNVWYSLPSSLLVTLE